MNETPSPRPEVRPTVGVGIVIIRAGQVLLIRRGKAPRLGEWSIPGGRQEPGETVRETAVREALEETNLAIANLRLIDVVDAFHRDGAGAVTSHWTLVDFRADWSGGEAQAGGDAAAVQWVALTHIESYGLWSETVRIIKAAAALA